jgi:hypothetical protein
VSADHVPIAPLHAIFDAAKHFGLTDDEVWEALNECFSEDGDSTVGECLDELISALARRIVEAATEPPRRRSSPD